MASTSVPQLIAYAEIAGYSGVRGLQTSGPPLLVWGLITGSPYMNAGVTAMSALMTKVDLNGDVYMQTHTEESYIYLVSSYSFVVGIVSIIMALVGFGKLAQNVPKPIRSGFKWGCAVGVLMSNIPSGLFNSGNKELKSLMRNSSGGGSSGNAIDAIFSSIQDLIKTYFSAATGAMNVTDVVYGLTHPWYWSFIPTIMFVVGTWFVMDGSKAVLPKFLPPGTEVILVTAVATLYSMYFNYPGSIVGDIPTIDEESGISILGIQLPIEVLDMTKIWNTLTTSLVNDVFGGSYILLIISSCLFAGVNFLQIVGIASTFENENDIKWDAPRELIAQGVSCLSASVVGSAPVSGSMSRSLVSRMTGTTSQLACLITAIMWITMLPYMSIMSPTPKAALSAVVVSAVLQGVVNPKDLLKLNGFDSIVGWCTALCTALTSPTIGFGVGLLVYFVGSQLGFGGRSKRVKEKNG